MVRYSEVNWEKARLVRCSPLPDEAFPSHLLRLARMNVLEIEAILGKRQVSVKQLRDFGIGMVEYCRHLFSSSDALTMRRRHTLLPYWLPDRLHLLTSEDATDSLIAKMLKGASTAGNFLKCCPSCVGDEILHFGFAYWHLSHQLPLSSVCTKHRDRLERCFLTANFGLPSEIPLNVRGLESSKKLDALAIAGENVLRASVEPEQRSVLLKSLQANILRDGFRRLGAISIGAELRDLIQSETSLETVMSDREIEDGLLEFLECPHRGVDSSLLTLLVARQILTGAFPIAAD